MNCYCVNLDSLILKKTLIAVSFGIWSYLTSCSFSPCAKLTKANPVLTECRTRDRLICTFKLLP